MFDFHTHILPGIDDGSHSVRESLSMIDELARQGATGIAATPHFYAHQYSPEQFFAKRADAWAKLEPYLKPGLPEIRLGAEVHYFEGINHYEGLERFCIDGTRLLLLEMPVCSWTARMVAAVAEMNDRDNLRVLLAHIERYLPYGNREACKSLADQGVLIQVSTGFFVEKRWRAMKLLRDGYIHFLGTDSHNMDSRRPDLAPAMEIITRKMGKQWLAELEQREEGVLNEAQSNVDCLHYRGTSDMPRDLRYAESPYGG